MFNNIGVAGPSESKWKPSLPTKAGEQKSKLGRFAAKTGGVSGSSEPPKPTEIAQPESTSSLKHKTVAGLKNLSGNLKSIAARIGSAALDLFVKLVPDSPPGSYDYFGPTQEESRVREASASPPSKAKAQSVKKSRAKPFKMPATQPFKKGALTMPVSRGPNHVNRDQIGDLNFSFGGMDIRWVSAEKVPNSAKKVFKELSNCDPTWGESPEELLSRERNCNDAGERGTGIKMALPVEGITGLVSYQGYRDIGHIVYENVEKKPKSPEEKNAVVREIFNDLGTKMNLDEVSRKLDPDKQNMAKHVAFAGITQALDAEFSNFITAFSSKHGVQAKGDKQVPPVVTMEVSEGKIYVTVTRLQKVTDEDEKADGGHIGFTRRLIVDIATAKSEEGPGTWIYEKPQRK